MHCGGVSPFILKDSYFRERESDAFLVQKKGWSSGGGIAHSSWTVEKPREPFLVGWQAGNLSSEGERCVAVYKKEIDGEQLVIE
jgi:hypothetical protein